MCFLHFLILLSHFSFCLSFYRFSPFSQSGILFSPFQKQKNKIKTEYKCNSIQIYFRVCLRRMCFCENQKKKIFINKDNGYEHLKMFEARKLDWIFWISKEIKKNGTNIWNRQTNEKKKKWKKTKRKNTWE